MMMIKRQNEGEWKKEPKKKTHGVKPDQQVIKS